jgi:A/G-specific adenine glycosylase
MLLQGFSKSYELRGNLTQQVTQVSDAVPPPLASAVAKAIKKVIYKRIESIQSHLLDWFKKNQRSFPWRETRDPYKVLLAEKLLQQTAAREKVVGAYNEIVHLYPNIMALAMAEPEQLKRIIAPLGFVYRADELPRLAQEVLNRDHGEIPSSLNELLALPGVGDYSARAVLAFAHNQNVPIVDTNVARLLHRIYGITESLPSNPARNKNLIEMAETLLPEGKAREFNLAILDLCATHCTARHPICNQCPIQKHCEYGKRLSQEFNGRDHHIALRQDA